METHNCLTATTSRAEENLLFKLQRKIQPSHGDGDGFDDGGGSSGSAGKASLLSVSCWSWKS